MVIHHSIQNFYRTMNFNCDPINWTSHKVEIQKLFNIAKVSSMDFTNTLIIGAGNAYDLPLSEIAACYKNIDLLDIDWQTIHETKHKFDESTQQKIKLINIDIVDIPVDEVQEIVSCLSTNAMRARKLLNALLIDFRVCPIHILEPTTYSLVISSTVSSQLVIPFVQVVEQSGNRELITLAKHFGDLVAEKHLQQLWQFLKAETGVGIITSEQYAWGYFADRRPLPLTNLIDNPASMLRQDVQLEIERLRGGLTINGRITSSMIQKVIPTKNIVLKKQWIWQFSEDIYYLVEGWIISK
ncbi:hypothetical protein [Paenibacillus sp. GCM10012303]|uniref:hypothetical protein n=1 Tax=Paenibacillus sp. GCM10012303 TaxID=3317340 RepID=UPI00360A72B9